MQDDNTDLLSNFNVLQKDFSVEPSAQELSVLRPRVAL